MAPEYAMHGYLTDKADVYSFGILALEILHGKNNTTLRPKEEAFYLLDYVSILVLCLTIIVFEKSDQMVSIWKDQIYNMF